MHRERERERERVASIARSRDGTHGRRAYGQFSKFNIMMIVQQFNFISNVQYYFKVQMFNNSIIFQNCQKLNRPSPWDILVFKGNSGN